jgi:hypothetical protein
MTCAAVEETRAARHRRTEVPLHAMAIGVMMMTLATMATVVLGAAAATPVTPGMKSIGVAIKAATLEKGVEKTVRVMQCLWPCSVHSLDRDRMYRVRVRVDARACAGCMAW